MIIEVDVTHTDTLTDLGHYGITYCVLQEVGPAGGNPLVELNGSRADLGRWLLENNYEVELYL